jgi:uncharacterized iron-regulated protein
MHRFVSLFLGLAILWGCQSPTERTASPASPAAPGSPWVSEVAADHPLAGRVWRTAEGRFVAPEAVLAALRGADFVLLGEKHDNADHHLIQAWLLKALIGSGRRPAVAFEMLTTDQQAPLEVHLAAHPQDADGLAEAVAWAESGWPDWSLYRPVFRAALDSPPGTPPGSPLPLLAASPPRAQLRAVAREGVAALGSERVADLRLEETLPGPDMAALRREIARSHCDQLPDSMIGPMVTVTRVKDALMAETLVQGRGLAGTDGAVLIAGAGHVRADRGVPWHLNRFATGTLIVTLGLLEVAAGQAEPPSYAEAYGAAALPFDFVWFTPRADDLDPCEAFGTQLEKAKQRHLQVPQGGE